MIKVGGRTFKKSFNKTFKSPYPYKEFLEAKKVVNGNPVLNYSQYGLKTIGGVDDLLDIKGQGENLINEYNKNPKPLIVKNLKGGILKAQKGLYVEKNDATKVTPKRLTQKAPEVNTTSEMLNGTFNPNAKMGLIPVSPEFMAFTGGVGGLATKATTAAGKIGSAALHGAGQGAMANVSGVGSEQSLSGLATDILGGAIAGGIIKGTPIAANYLKGQYYKHTFDPMKVNLQRYKGLVAPDEVMGIVDKFKLKQLSKKTDKLSKKSAE